MGSPPNVDHAAVDAAFAAHKEALSVEDKARAALEAACDDPRECDAFGGRSRRLDDLALALDFAAEARRCAARRVGELLGLPVRRG